MSEPLPSSAAFFAAQLRRAALVLWLASLALPGFLLSGHDAPKFGYEVLLVGFFFGWAVCGWAVYANLAFVYATVALDKGRSPTRAVGLMLALTATLPFFVGVPRNEGNPTPVPVASWGWGVVVWVAAIVLLALAWAVATGRCSLRTAKWAIAGLAASLVGVVGVHAWQWREANAQERATTLALGQAFTTSPLCRIAVTEVSGPLIAQGKMIALEGAAGATGPGNWGWEPAGYVELGVFQLDGVTWAAPSAHLNVQVPVRADSPVLRVDRTEAEAVMTIRASVGGPVVYEQRFERLAIRGGRNRFCPASASELPGHEDLGYDTHLRRALGPISKLQPRPFPEAAETAMPSCPLGPRADNLIGSPRVWDGRTVRILGEDLEAGEGFCSRSHLGLLRIRTEDGALPDGRAPARASVVQLAVFDRDNLSWRTWFIGRLPCDAPDCRLLKPEDVEAIEIRSTAARLRTAIGEFGLRPYPDSRH